ncbi:MAG: PAS domain-containing sensor histidine kinase [Sphingomonas taxi]|uniref:histidine kinase n=1 Tax=Sphingomonas taxi TaxID=1549858 RepID=A0A2W5PC51_9SPHN|nr:MAG: PAS domain-containing sensor histidine kinase [Sphingomonas taxi]
MNRHFHALVDRDGGLLSADAVFAALNDRAAGRPGAALALAPLATLVRIARGLRVAIARTVTLADERSDGDWYVRAIPGDDGTVALAAALRGERPARAAAPGMLAAVAPPPGADWEWEVDAALRLTRIAPAAARHGVDAVTSLGGPLTALFVLEASPEGAMPLIEAMATACGFCEQAATLRGHGRRVLLAGTVRRDAAGGFAGFVGGTFADGAADTSGERGDAFNARLHRVLRAPLGSIIARAEEIRAAGDGTLDPRYVDYAGDIASAGRHLLGLVDDLVDMEAIERPDFTTARDRIDLGEVARAASGLLAAVAAERGVTIAPLPDDASAIAIGEYRRALQIVVNLLGNAVRYSPRGGNVRLRLKRRDGQVRLVVCDQGPGIAPGDQARIFEKFTRGDTSDPDGNGLGLYIARRLAQAMQGLLTVESEVGRGACFTLSLPAAV